MGISGSKLGLPEDIPMEEFKEHEGSADCPCQNCQRVWTWLLALEELRSPPWDETDDTREEVGWFPETPDGSLYWEG